MKFRRLLAVIGHCRAWIDYKIRKHYSTRFGRYCVLSTNHRESIYFANKVSPVVSQPGLTKTSTSVQRVNVCMFQMATQHTKKQKQKQKQKNKNKNKQTCI